VQDELDESKQRSGKQVCLMFNYFNGLKPEMECHDQKVSGYGRNIVYSVFIDFYYMTILGRIVG